jgi:hypothetical protein
LKNPSFFLNEEAELVCAPEPNGLPYFCQWAFAAPAKSPILLKIINLSAQRILSIPEIKGEHIIHHLTGPEVFTDGIEMFLREKGLATFPNKTDYSRKHSILAVFYWDRFHNEFVQHLFAGSDRDGWKNEKRYKL